MIGLIVRCKDEPYVDEFVSYYLSQGVDKIYIVDDDSNQEICKNIILNKNVELIMNNDRIKTTLSNQFQRCSELYKKIKHLYEWMIIVDMDEFITTKKSPDNTIKTELETTFKNADCIKIPWVMMSCNGLEKNPASLLKTNVYRWNHDKKHENRVSNQRKFRCRYNEIEVKCIFRPVCFDNINFHIPLNPNRPVKIVDGVKNLRSEHSPFYSNLREANIKDGFLLCYHYRIISVENCIAKLKNSGIYKEYEYGLEDLLSNDYPEVMDRTMCNRVPYRFERDFSGGSL